MFKPDSDIFPAGENGVINLLPDRKTGSGIVADSDPQAEYEETLAKARAFFERLVAAINESPDSLHGDRTPAVHALVEHGRDVDELTQVQDLLPTLIELCDLPANPALEGHSLAPQLADSGGGPAVAVDSTSTKTESRQAIVA